jgi:hypothetical protein
MVDDKTKKAAIKEGGKKGVDMAGMSDLGGVKFFNLSVDTPNGDLDVLELVLQGMNAEVDESAEERKGGSGHLGKMLLSAGDKTVAFICHVPKALQEEKADTGFLIKEWVEAVCKAASAEVVEETEEIVKIRGEGSVEKELFPLKMRDAAQAAGFAYIKSKGLIPDDDSDDYIPEVPEDW